MFVVGIDVKANIPGFAMGSVMKVRADILTNIEKYIIAERKKWGILN